MSLLTYTLRLADSNLILGQRLAEWISRGPTLEEDIALTNMSLDFIGQAQAYYELAQTLDPEKKSPDSFAFLRTEREYFNFLLCELPIGHFGDTMARQFFYDYYQVLFYEALSKSKNETLSYIAQRALKEATYHFRHSSTWIVRLGLGTLESKSKIQESLNNLWAYTGEMFEVDEIDETLISLGIAVDTRLLVGPWKNKISEVIKQAQLEIPASTFMQKGGKRGLHSEHLGRLLSEMQILPRTYPGVQW